MWTGHLPVLGTAVPPAHHTARSTRHVLGTSLSAFLLAPVWAHMLALFVELILDFSSRTAFSRRWEASRFPHPLAVIIKGSPQPTPLGEAKPHN